MIDAHGRTVARGEAIGESINGFRRYQENGLCGYMDAACSVVIPAVYADGGDFGKNGLCPVQDAQTGRWNYINAAGDTVFSVDCEFAGSFGNDEYTVLDYDRWINERGEVIAPFVMDDAW